MRNIFLVLVSLFIAMPCWAAKIYLNSGSMVEGKVVETASDSVKVDVGGVPVTYYKDEIARIEGDDDAARALGLDGGSSGQAEPVSQASDTQAVVPVVAPVADMPQASSPEVAQAESQQIAPVQASSMVAPQKRELILKFIDAFGTRQAMVSNFAQMLTQLPADQAEKLRGIFSVDAIIQELVPVYDRHFSEAELTSFINFYSSVEGRKLVSTVPQIMKESVDVSAKYFEARMPEELKNLPAPKAK
ncbi:MAG: DUF2059 domain-containing protein [Candidatus Omnitrophica bacterium]|nr:DUF2059 domain-containing protein [Candidatus Omnitrophota bacterium]